MVPKEQWLEVCPDDYDDETGDLICKGGTVYCMTAFCSAAEHKTLKGDYAPQSSSINHGFDLKGMANPEMDTYNVCFKTQDPEVFERVGGSVVMAKAHGYDTHPNSRRPKSAVSAAIA